MPCVSSSGCLASPLLLPSSLLFPWTRLTHTHTHINTGDTSIHVYTITGLIQRHKRVQGTRVFQELKTPCPALLETASVGTMSCPWSSLSTSSLSTSEGSLKQLPVQHVWLWRDADWWMCKFTEDPKVSTQVHWDTGQDALQ